MTNELRERPKDTYSVIWNAVWNAAGLDDGECESITQAVLTAMGDLITRQELDEAVAAEREACAEIAMKISGEFMKNHGMAETVRKRFDVYDMQRFANKGILLCGEDIDKAIRARSEQKEGE